MAFSGAIIGLGNDLLRIDRIRRMGARNAEMLLQRVLSPSEREAASPLGTPNWRRVAALVASKEAFFKALGTGLVQPFRWVDVVVSGPATGADAVSVGGRQRRHLPQAAAFHAFSRSVVTKFSCLRLLSYSAAKKQGRREVSPPTSQLGQKIPELSCPHLSRNQIFRGF